jgi:type I restriction enzyme S subunit
MLELETAHSQGASSAKYLVEEGDLIYSKIRPALNKVCLAHGDWLCSADMYPIRIRKGYEARYLKYLMLSQAFKHLMVNDSMRVAMPKVNRDTLNAARILRPPLDEQRAITDYLDRETERIDALIEKKEQLIDLLEEKRTALISRVVTQGLDGDVEMQDSGVGWLGEIPAHWDTIKLKWHTDKIGSGVTPDGGSEAYVDEGITFLRSQNVHFDGLRLDDVAYIDEETDEEMEATRVHPWDVLLNITGASIGRCTLVPKDFPRANVNQHVCIIRAQRDELHPPYLNHVMASSVGQEQIFAEIDGASRDAVTFAEIGNFITPKSPLEEQRRIAKHVEHRTSRIYSLIEKIEEGIERLNEYRTALISAAVTGQIDVREKSTTPDVKEAGTWERMILTVELIRRMRAAEHQSFGRTMLVKMLYLIQHHLRIKGLRFNYERKDYGPYASEIHKVENPLQKQGWIYFSKQDGQVWYDLQEKADDETVQSRFEKSWGDVKEQIDEIVTYFHRFNAERAEIVATLYAAWNDLKILGRPHDEDDIIREVRENWHPRKQEIDESRWEKALQWMKDEGLVPTGFGEPTIEGEG